MHREDIKTVCINNVEKYRNASSKRHWNKLGVACARVVFLLNTTGYFEKYEFEGKKQNKSEGTASKAKELAQFNW